MFRYPRRLRKIFIEFYEDFDSAQTLWNLVRNPLMKRNVTLRYAVLRFVTLFHVMSLFYVVRYYSMLRYVAFSYVSIRDVMLRYDIVFC